MMKRIIIVLICMVCVFNIGLKAQISKQNPQIYSIDVIHYDFNISLSDKSNIIQVNSIVKLRFLENTDIFYFDLKNEKEGKGMKVFNVSVEDRNLNFEQKDDKIFFINEKWEKNDTIDVNIKYGGIPKDGLIISKNKYGKRTFFGDNWPNRAHHWLSVVDHPSDKASVDFKIIAPEHYDVIANGKLLETKELDLNTKFSHFSTKGIPIPSKVMVIGLADFDIKDYGKIANIPITSMVFQPSPVNGLDDYLPALDVMKYFIDSIGYYSYLKLANVQSKTRYGGMENAGNIFYSETSVNGKSSVESLVAHEIAHQWFGNSATEYSWFDIWLSEGFATYLTDMFLEFKYGKDRLRERMEMERKKVIRYNSMISKPVIDTSITNWNKLLNPNSYEKGAWVLHMLRHKIGEKSFIETLRKYYKKYQNKNSTTEDFRKVAEKESNQDLKSFFDQWLRKPGFPQLEINWKIKNGLLIINTTQLKGDFDFKLPIRIQNNNNGKSIDYDIDIKCKNKSVLLKIDEGFSEENSNLIIDPNVVLLHSASLSQMDIKIDTIPLIQDGKLLMKGDLLFQDIDCGPLCDAIESVTRGYENANFSHVGIVKSITGNNVTIIEAIGEVVSTISLENFLKRSKDECDHPKVVVGRLEDKEIIDISLSNLDKYLGKAYDDGFDSKNDSYYCSELVYFAFIDKKGGNVFSMSPMTYKDKKTGKYFKPWIDYFNKLNKDIPEGKPGINPGGISLSQKVKILYKFGNPEGW